MAECVFVDATRHRLASTLGSYMQLHFASLRPATSRLRRARALPRLCSVDPRAMLPVRERAGGCLLALSCLQTRTFDDLLII